MSKKGINSNISEEILELFLSKIQIKKLHTLNMLNSGSISIKKLEKVFSLSPKKAKVFSRLFAEEVNSYNLESNEYLTIVNDTIRFNNTLEQYEYAKIINQTRETYVKNSSLYRFLLYILEKRKFTIQGITKDIFYSKSYTYKLLFKVKLLFSLLNLNLSLHKSDEYYLLEGEEIILRYLHYFSISIVSKGSNNFFNNNTRSRVTDFFLQKYSKSIHSLSPIGKARVNYFLNIFAISLNNKSYLLPLESEVLELASNLGIYKKEINNMYYKESSEKDIFINELISLIFVTSYFTQELYNDSEKSEFGKKLLVFKNNPIVSICQNILQEISFKYPLDSFTFNLLLYNLCNNFILIHYLKLYKFIYSIEDHYYGTVDIQFVENCISSYLDEYKSSQGYSKIKNNFFQTIVSEIAIVPRLVIYVEFFHQPEYKSFIHNTLKRIYNPDLIEITENYNKANIILSDTIGYDLNKKQYYYFKNIFDKDSWIRLSEYLNKIVINSNLSSIMNNNDI